MTRVAGDALVGRQEPLSRLGSVIDRVLAGDRVTVLVSGEAGIGKTSLVRAATSVTAERGAYLPWGSCVDVAGAPGYWPWSQALGWLVRTMGVEEALRLAGDDAPLLATLVPLFGTTRYGEATDRERLLLLDASCRFLDTVSVQRPVIVVIDDLQWADESSLALFEFVVRAPHRAGVGLIGVYRHDEIPPPIRQRLAALVSHGEHLHVEGLDVSGVRDLVERLLGGDIDDQTAESIHRRTGGHPFFVREMVLQADPTSEGPEHPPVAVRKLIERRIERLSQTTRKVLEVVAVTGTRLLPDVVARVLDTTDLQVGEAAREAVEAGVLSPADDGLRFTHDLLRETVLDALEPSHVVALHLGIGSALEERSARSGDVTPADLARHFTAAVSIDGPSRAIRWALAAAAADRAALAFGEAAGHLRRLRAAVADAAIVVGDVELCDVLLAEADVRARAGKTVDARGLLRAAGDAAQRAPDPRRIALVAMATARLGAQFAARRDDVIAELERALDVVAGSDPALEAQLAATLARELQHSVPEDRPRASALSQRALDLGRQSVDPRTLSACLLARHDVLWTPGTAEDRAAVAKEIVSSALDAGDDELHAEGLLLLANALLERGSPAFEAVLEDCLALYDRLAQPRHRYLAVSRRACVALLRSDLDEAAVLIEQAASLGQRIREPDTGNVVMSQRLELVRSRGNPEELLAFAAEAVRHWTGAPIHAHAVAAGFCATAGDLDNARRHIAIVEDLGGWRTDRSYLWSVFVRELGRAAAILGDHDLCARLLEDVRPLASCCGVNGALVAFAGSHAHTAGVLAGALGHTDLADQFLEQASNAYARLGAAGWLTETHAAAPGHSTGAGAPALMRRVGSVWEISFRGHTASVPHVKGLGDIARLVAQPGTEIHVLDLIDAGDRSGPAGSVIDRQALAAYRRRLAELESDLEEARRFHDQERIARCVAERQALLEEVSRATGPRGRPRQFAGHPAERARKAVAARVRDAIGKLEPALPELASHLQRTIVTGNYCRYRATIPWEVQDSGEHPRDATR